VIILRLLSGIALSRKDVAQSALIGAIGLGILKLASGRLLANAGNKPLLAGFAAIIGLLVLINLISRVVLLAASWSATTLREHGRLALPAGPSAGRYEAAARSDAGGRLEAGRGGPLRRPRSPPYLRGSVLMLSRVLRNLAPPPFPRPPKLI